MSEQLSEHQQKVADGIAWLTKYMVTYDKQYGYLDFTDEMIINDVLYGLGVAIGGDQYRHANGFEVFKEVLRKHLGLSPR